MDICGCSFVFVFCLNFSFCSHVRRVGFASALLPYGHWVVLVIFFYYYFLLFWGRVAGITRTRTRSSNWTFACGCGSWNAMINHGAEAGKIKDGLCFVENGVQGRRTLEGTERAIWVHTCLHLNPHKHSHPALTNSPMHFCSFKLWGTILGMGAQLQQEDCYDFDKVTEKIFPNWNKRLEKHVFSHLLCIYIHIFVLSFRVERKICKRMKENSWDVDYMEWMFFKETNLFEYSLR